MRTKLIVVLTAFAAITAIVAAAVLFSIDSQKPGTDIPSQAALSSGAEVSGQPAPAAVVAESASSRGATTEGITVHGHWVIEVRDPDGSLVQRREFDNVLSTSGAEMLAKVLAKERIFGEWAVTLQGSPGTDAACLSGTVVTSCAITEASTQLSNFFPNLSLVRNTSQVVLSGTATAQRDGNVATVTSQNKLCDPINTSSCDGFTVLTVQSFTPISVSTGQSILATVTISFS